MKKEIMEIVENEESSLSEQAVGLRKALEDGLNEIDLLPPIDRSCGLIALRTELKLGVQQFEKLVDAMIRSREESPPDSFDACMAYSHSKYIVEDLLGVGLTLFAADGYTGKSTFAYELIEAITNGSKFASQFQTSKAPTLIVQLDESSNDAAIKWRRMSLDPDRNNFKIKWKFTPLEFPELKEEIKSRGVKVVVLDSLMGIAGGQISPKDAEFGLLIYRLNKLAGELAISIICIHHITKQKGRKQVVKEDIFGTAYVYNGSADCWGYWKESAPNGWVYNLKILKSRSATVDANTTYQFDGNEEDYRLTFTGRADGNASLDQLKNQREKVRLFLQNHPEMSFSPKQVNDRLGLCSIGYARNILSKLYTSRAGVDRIKLPSTGGRPTYVYKSCVKV